MTIIGGLSIWLSNAPLNLDRFKPRLEALMNEASSDFDIKIGALNLSWPALTEPILFDMRMVEISQSSKVGAEQKVTSNLDTTIDNVKIGLSARHLLIGKVLPSIIIIEDPVLQLIQRDGKFDITWQSPSNKNIESEKLSQDLNFQGEKISSIDFLEKIFPSKRNEINILSALKWVELKRAIIKSADIEAEEMDYIALADLILFKDNVGLQGDLKVILPGQNGQNATFNADIMVRRGEGDITLTSTVQDLNPVQFSPIFPNLEILKRQDLLIGGSIKAAFDRHFQFQSAILDFNVPTGKVTIPDAYDDGLALNDIHFDAHLDMAQKRFDIAKFTANIGDIPIIVEGTSRAEGENIVLPLTVTIPEALMDNVGAIFPKSHADSAAGKWLTKRLRKGVLKDAVLSTDFHLIHDSETGSYNGEMTNVKARFDSENMTVQYSDSLTPVINAKASGVYEDDTLTIIGERGEIGDVIGRNINLKMTNLSVAGGGMAYLTLDGVGPFRSVLDYASDEPIGLGDDLGFDIKTVQGNIDFKLDLQFPTLKELPKEEVIVKIDGTLTDILIPNVVQGLPLSGGPYALKFKDGKISLEGSGQLAGRDIDLTWQEYFDATGKDYESKITAKLIADEGLRQAFNIGLEDYISGSVPVDVTYIDQGVPATIQVKGDLAPAILHIDPFDYYKPAGQPGSISLSAFMRNDSLKEVTQLEVSADKFQLKDGRLIFKKLPDGRDDVSRGSIAEATLDRTKLKVDFEMTPQNILKVVAKGPTLELKPFVGGEHSGSQEPNKPEWENPQNNVGRPMQISVEADRLLAEKDQILNRAKLYLELDKQNDVTRLEMDAAVGKGAMFLRFKPDAVSNKRTFRLESTDAGAMLKAFGLYDKINGGELIVYGEPRQGDNQGDLFGKAQITNFSVGEAPVLAKLLGAMSQSGIQNALQNNDLTFAKLESDFEWQFREGANLLVMKNGRTSGSSLGLTFEGVYNQGKSNVDISGTVIPLSGVNEVVGNIPVIGQILTGGKALLAATYGVKGPSNDPKVSINPLSVLAPGFLRRILFEESVESKVQKAQ